MKELFGEIAAEFRLNPYWNRMAIEDFDSFFGREAELAELYGYILRGTSVSVVGERRIGKSSLLRALNFDEFRRWSDAPASLKLVYLDGSYFTDCSEESFLASVVDQIEEDIEVSAQAEGRREALWQLGKTAKQKGIRVALLIDEFDVIALNVKISQSSIFDFLRAFSQEFRIPLVMVSKDGSLDSLIHATANSIGSPFWNIFTNVVYVGPLLPDDAERLIREPAADCGRPFTEDEVSHIRRLGGHHPFYLQIACYHAYQGRRGPLLEHAFAADAKPQFEYLLAQLPERELFALRNFALTRRVPEDQVLFDIRKKGLLVPGEKGELRVFSSLFEETLADSDRAKSAALRTGLWPSRPNLSITQGELP